MIQVSTLRKRPSFVRKILLGEREAEVKLKTVDDLRFLDQNGLLDKVSFVYRSFPGSFAQRLCKAVSNGEVEEQELRRWLSKPPIRHAAAEGHRLAMPDLLLDILAGYERTKVKLVESLAVRPLRKLYEKDGRVGHRILRRYAYIGDSSLETLVDEILERDLESLRVFALMTPKYETERFSDDATEKFWQISRKDGIVGAYGVTLLGEALLREYKNSPSLLKRMAVAYRTNNQETLKELVEDESIEVRLILMIRGYSIDAALETIFSGKPVRTSTPQSGEFLRDILFALRGEVPPRPAPNSLGRNLLPSSDDNLSRLTCSGPANGL